MEWYNGSSTTNSLLAAAVSLYGAGRSHTPKVAICVTAAAGGGAAVMQALAEKRDPRVS